MKLEAIPAIDLMGGRCVRLVGGDFARVTVYDDDPPRRAAAWAEAGARRIHVVDLDSARGAGSNRATVERIVREARVEVQVAGGVRDGAAVAAWLGAGAAAVVMGTTAIKDLDTLRAAAGAAPGRVHAALDVRGGAPAVEGWSVTVPARVTDLVAEWNGIPLGGVIFTSIERDGSMSGVDVAGLRAVVEASVHPVTYSGGIAGLDDITAAARAGAAAVILGRALYSGAITLAGAIAAAGHGAA